MEMIKRWNKNGFTLKLWDTYKRDSYGKNILQYEFKDGKKVIFSGNDFACSPMHSIDSLNTIYSLLGFFTVDKHDTDEDFFKHYTKEQIEWRDSERREELNTMVYEWEEKANSKLKVYK
jgi:hypothetical protein